jgi:hypothetical protein
MQILVPQAPDAGAPRRSPRGVVAAGIRRRGRGGRRGLQWIDDLEALTACTGMRSFPLAPACTDKLGDRPGAEAARGPGSEGRQPLRGALSACLQLPAHPDFTPRHYHAPRPCRPARCPDRLTNVGCPPQQNERNKKLLQGKRNKSGGGGIRTHEGVAPLRHFECRALGRTMRLHR